MIAFHPAKWSEVWTDELYGQALLIVLETEAGEILILNPHEGNRIEDRFATYDEAVDWLREDEYTLVEGRVDVSRHA